jgi:hypothetical protein
VTDDKNVDAVIGDTTTTQTGCLAAALAPAAMVGGPARVPKIASGAGPPTRPDIAIVERGPADAERRKVQLCQARARVDRGERGRRCPLAQAASRGRPLRPHATEPGASRGISSMAAG